MLANPGMAPGSSGGPDGPWVVDCGVMSPPGTARSLDLTPLAYYPQGPNGDRCPPGHTLTPYTWDPSVKTCIRGGESFQQSDSGTAQMCNMRQAAPDASGANPRLWATRMPFPPPPPPPPITFPPNLTASNVGQVIQNRLAPVVSAIDNLVPLIKASVGRLVSQGFGQIIGGISGQPRQFGGLSIAAPSVRAPVRIPQRVAISTLTPQQLDQALQQRLEPILNTVNNMDEIVRQAITEIIAGIFTPLRGMSQGEPQGGGRKSTRRRRRGTPKR